MSITFTRGKEWWLQRTRKNGKQRYPDRIVVGDLRKARVYEPVKKPNGRYKTIDHITGEEN